MTTHLRFAGVCAALAVASETRAEPFTLSEKTGHITEGTVIVDATPAEVYAVVTDYENWRSVFSDVVSVDVKSGDREHAKVRFKSRALEHKVTVEFDNTPDRLITFRGIKGPPGGRARGWYVLTPLPGGRTQIQANLYMDVVGAPSVFVSDSKIRSMRQAKLRADMTDVMRRFPPRGGQGRQLTPSM
jgi:hypothetical protein